MKIGKYIDNIEVPWIQNNSKYRFKYDNGTECLKFTTEGSQTELLIKTIPFIRGNWYVLYVLLATHNDNKPGRYQSIEFTDSIDLVIFLNKYKSYIDEDGRHNIWIGSTRFSDLLVLDNHNIFHYYGNVGGLDKELADFDLTEIKIPAPHTHHYNAIYSDSEREILSEFDWKYFPLNDSDDS